MQIEYNAQSNIECNAQNRMQCTPLYLQIKCTHIYIYIDDSPEKIGVVYPMFQTKQWEWVKRRHSTQ